MREFALVDGNGEEYSLTVKESFLHNPSGLGFEHDNTYRQVGDRFIKVNTNPKQGKIEGTIHFHPESAYDEYQNFVEFAGRDGLKLEYRLKEASARNRTRKYFIVNWHDVTDKQTWYGSYDFITGVYKVDSVSERATAENVSYIRDCSPYGKVYAFTLPNRADIAKPIYANGLSLSVFAYTAAGVYRENCFFSPSDDSTIYFFLRNDFMAGMTIAEVLAQRALMFTYSLATPITGTDSTYAKQYTLEYNVILRLYTMKNLNAAHSFNVFCRYMSADLDTLVEKNGTLLPLTDGKQGSEVPNLQISAYLNATSGRFARSKSNVCYQSAENALASGLEPLSDSFVAEAITYQGMTYTAPTAPTYATGGSDMREWRTSKVATHYSDLQYLHGFIPAIPIAYVQEGCTYELLGGLEVRVPQLVRATHSSSGSSSSGGSSTIIVTDLATTQTNVCGYLSFNSSNDDRVVDYFKDVYLTNTNMTYNYDEENEQWQPIDPPENSPYDMLIYDEARTTWNNNILAFFAKFNNSEITDSSISENTQRELVETINLGEPLVDGLVKVYHVNQGSFMPEDPTHGSGYVEFGTKIVMNHSKPVQFVAPQSGLLYLHIGSVNLGDVSSGAHGSITTTADTANPTFTIKSITPLYLQADHIDGSAQDYSENLVDTTAPEKFGVSIESSLSQHYSRQVEVSKLEKTELDKNSSLESKVTFECIEPWIDPVTSYGESNVMSVLSDSHTLGPCTIYISGPVKYPKWEQYVDGSLISTGVYNGSIADGETLEIHTKQGENSMYLYGESSVQDVYQNSDFTTDRFMYIRYGTNEFRVSVLAYIPTADTSFASGKTYYELVDGNYVATSDSTMDAEKTYYESNSAAGDIECRLEGELYYESV